MHQRNASLGVSDCTPNASESHHTRAYQRDSHPLTLVTIWTLLLLGSYAALGDIVKAIDAAPRITIPIVIVACILIVGRTLWLEVRR